jgi:hypothetical protein
MKMIIKAYMSYACLPSVGKFGDRKISSQLEIHKDYQTRMPRAQSPIGVRL